MALSDKIKELRSELGKTQLEFSKALGIATSTFQYYERGERDIPASVVSSLITTFGVNPLWLLSNKGQMFDIMAFDSKVPNDFVTIPLVNSRISAGAGLLPQEGVESCMCFRKDWIGRKGDAQNMSLIRVSGDSMEPTLSTGDIVLIDHSRNFINDFGMYAISVDDSILIKRLQPFSGKVQIISDNSKYPPIIVDAQDLIINGKALWYAHDLSD